MHALLIDSGNWFFKVRDLVSPVFFAAIVLLTRPRWLFGTATDVAIVVAGTLIVLAGQALRASVIGYAYVKRGGKDRKVYAETLVTEGLFNHSRNPLYVGNVLILLGLLVAYGSPVAFAIGTAFYLYMYLAITLAEERYLREKFGPDYDAYTARVNRYVPELRAASPNSLAGMRFDWARLVRKEYGTTFAWFMTLLGILAWKSYRTRGIWDGGLMIGLGVALGLGAIAYATARILKKRDVLGRG